jgi:hypothetical protein
MKFRLAIALCLAAGPALTDAARADTREQVMLRLPRCSSIGETRQYLDCYYAAIQPMRDELHLAAAPQSATYAPLFSLGGAPSQGTILTPQVAATREDVMLRLTRCSAIGDTRQYMDCYYAAAQPMRAELGLAPAPQAATYAPLFSLTQSLPASQRIGAVPDPARPNLVPQTAYSQAAFTPPRPRNVGEGPTSLPFIGGLVGISSKRVPEAQFGFPDAPSVANGVNHVAATITSWEQDRYTQRFTVTLENGQVWTQVPMDDMKAHWNKGKQMTATIAYGAGGTFNLSVGEGVLYKVRRVK